MDIRKIVFFDDKLRAEQRAAQAVIMNTKDDATKKKLSIVYRKWVEGKLWLAETRKHIPVIEMNFDGVD